MRSPNRRNGFPLSKAALTEIVSGDLLGAAIALIGVIALLRQSELGFWLAWLVVVETVVDLAIAIHRRRREPLKEEPSGPLWLMLAFYVPLMVVTLPVLFWLLVTRGGALS
jgi:hypothetical protein